MGTTERLMNCEACGKAFSPRSGGRPQKFCKNPCFRATRLKQGRSCIRCESPIEKGGSKFCSVACRTESQRIASKKHVITCKCCGKEHLTNRPDNQYCSADCYGMATRKRPDCKCKWCGESFRMGHGSRRKGLFCSREHAWRSTVAPRIVGRLQERFQERLAGKHVSTTKQCDRCGVEIAKHRIRCLECTKAVAREYARQIHRQENPLGKAVCGDCSREFSQERYGQKRCTACREIRAKDMQAAQRKRAKAKRKFWIRNTRIENVSPNAIYQRDGWTCGICGEEVLAGVQVPHPLAVTIDHIIPLSKGGTHTPDNLQCAHFSCNSKKGSTLPEWHDASLVVAE